MSERWVVVLAFGLPRVGSGNLIESRIPSSRSSPRSTSDLRAVGASASERRRALHSAAVAKIEGMSYASRPASSMSATTARAFHSIAKALGIRHSSNRSSWRIALSPTRNGSSSSPTAAIAIRCSGFLKAGRKPRLRAGPCRSIGTTAAMQIIGR